MGAGSHRSCDFCEFIIYYYNLVSLLILYRREQAAGTRAAKDVCSYGQSTGVAGYQKTPCKSAHSCLGHNM